MLSPFLLVAVFVIGWVPTNTFAMLGGFCFLVLLPFGLFLLFLADSVLREP